MSAKRKFTSKLGQPAVKPSAKPAAKESLNDSRAVVSRGGDPDRVGVSESSDIVEISSDSSSAGEEDEEDDEDDLGAEQEALQKSKEVKGDDVDMEDAKDQGMSAQIPDENEELAEPSFGDLVLANSSEPVDVAGAFHDSNFQPLSYPQGNKLQPPSGASLGTVLTQALKTNDIVLLESCLQTPDLTIIRATIQRLDSPLAGILLQKLAERLHRRPGRAGSLMVWVQWTLVTHGGYLATQPDLIKKLAELNRVIDERAKGLQSLLSLKGKLDMLEAQMQLRRSMRQQRRDLDDEDDEGVIYVEGEESESSDGGDQKQTTTNGTRSKSHREQENGNISANESEVSEDMPAISNGIIAHSDDESESGDNLIDDEAEDTDAESNDEDDVDHSDMDELDEEDDSDDAAPARAAPPTKMQKLGGLFSRSRH